MSSWTEYGNAGCLPVGHNAAHPRFRQVSQGTWSRRHQGLELRRTSGGDADYLAIAPELQPNRVDVSRKSRQTRGRRRWEADLLHSAQDTGWRPGRRLVFGGFREAPAAESALVAIRSGSRCLKHRQHVGGMRTWDELQQWLCTQSDPSLMNAGWTRLIILDQRTVLSYLQASGLILCANHSPLGPFLSCAKG